MKCPKCGGNNLKVIDTVSNLDDEVYRCRRCPDCENKFYTVEFEVEPDNKVMNTIKRAHCDKSAKNRQKRAASKKE